jgi:hypothetical protein
MTENEASFPAEQREIRNQARAEAVEAGQRLWQSYGVVDDAYDGAVVTGFVLVVEAVLPSGYTSIAWCSGNGQPPGTEGITGLPRHRVDGMVRHVIREVYDDAGASE